MNFLTSMPLLSIFKVLEPIDNDICLTNICSTYQQEHKFQLNTFLLHFCHVFKIDKKASSIVMGKNEASG